MPRFLIFRWVCVAHFSSVTWTDSPDSESGKPLAKACQKTGWEMPAYCLIRNHYPLVWETPEANLVVGRVWRHRTQAARARRRQSDPAKLALAARWRNETTLSLKAVSARLPLGQRRPKPSSPMDAGQRASSCRPADIRKRAKPNRLFYGLTHRCITLKP